MTLAPLTSLGLVHRNQSTRCDQPTSLCNQAQQAFREPGGERLRQWIDNCPNQLYSALVFQGGAAIALVSCHRGLNSRAGAEGVGRAATEAFVASFIVIR